MFNILKNGYNIADDCEDQKVPSSIIIGTAYDDPSKDTWVLCLPFTCKSISPVTRSTSVTNNNDKLVNEKAYNHHLSRPSGTAWFPFNNIVAECN